MLSWLTAEVTVMSWIPQLTPTTVCVRVCVFAPTSEIFNAWSESFWSSCYFYNTHTHTHTAVLITIDCPVLCNQSVFPVIDHSWIYGFSSWTGLTGSVFGLKSLPVAPRVRWCSLPPPESWNMLVIRRRRRICSDPSCDQLIRHEEDHTTV